MIKINLLPVELRPGKKIAIPVKSMSFIGVGIGVILLCFYIMIGVRINQEKERLDALGKEYEAIKPEYEKVKKLKADRDRLEAKVALMEKLIVQRLLWAKKLNQLSDLMPPQVWLSSLSVVSRTTTKHVDGKEISVPTRMLIIRGKTYSDKGEKMVEQVGDFMRSIKEHGPFFKDFVNVELVSTERETIAKTEIMKFELTCQFK